VRRSATASEVTLNAQGLPGTVTGPTGTTLQATYNAQGQPLTLTDPWNHTLSLQYTAAGLPLSVTNALLQTATATWDDAGRPQTMTDPLNRVTSLTLSPFSQAASVNGPLGSGYSVTRNGPHPGLDGHGRLCEPRLPRLLRGRDRGDQLQDRLTGGLGAVDSLVDVDRDMGRLDDAADGLRRCFPAATPVRMADGSQKPIGEGTTFMTQPIQTDFTSTSM
jgi:YD repeat-containing protein